MDIFYFLGGIILLFILSWIYARLSERGNPRRKLNRIGKTLYIQVANNEIKNAETENRPFDLGFVLATLYISMRKEFPSLEFLELHEKGGAYLSDLILSEPIIYNKFISAEMAHTIESIASEMDICGQIALAKIVEEEFGKEEARKYAYDILIGRLE